MIRLLFAALLGGAIPCAQAQAATVVLWPVDPVIAGDRNATALWLENKGAEEVTLQIRCLDWDQKSGEDALSPQDAVVASPPLARVAPGARQLVRLVRRSSQGAARERAFRILVDELPAPVPEGSTATPGARLSMQMRYSIPLFTYAGPADAGQPHLSFHVADANGRRVIEIANTGDRHARLTDLRGGPAGRLTPLRAGLAGYVLAGATVRWPVPADAQIQGLAAGVDGAEQAIAPAR